MQPANANTFISNANQHGLPFSNLKSDARACLDNLVTSVTYLRGDKLFAEGEKPKQILFLTTGRAKVFVTSQEGKTVILKIAEPGEILGLSAVLSGNDHEVTTEAMEPCSAKAVSARDFHAFLEKHPEAALEATRCVLHEYQSVFNEICRLALPSTVAGRVANLLLEWGRSRVQPGQARPRFTMTLTHEEIAGMTATSRETVTRVFNQFEREKLISIKGASLTVLQPEALAQLAA